MERSDVPDKLFAEDTLSYPNSVDGERPARHPTSSATVSGNRSPDEEMLAVEYREDEVRTGREAEGEMRAGARGADAR